MLRVVRGLLMLMPALFISNLSAVAETVPAPSTLNQITPDREGQNPASGIRPEMVPPESMSQVTSVSQLSDVRPTDWAFQALQSLVERYGCIAGYPDRTFRGNRALTRYEFAAGVNACLDRVNELIAASTANLVKKEDLMALQKLQEEFAAELATIRGRVDALEARTTTLEKQQFSTTTKLNGEVIFGFGGAFGGDRAVNSDQQRAIDAAADPEAERNNVITGSRTNADRGVRENFILANRVRLSLDTSFTGKDRLRTQLQARNIGSFSGAGATGITGTNMTRLGYDGSNNNTIELRRLEYRFPVGNRTMFYVGTGSNDGLEFNDAAPTLSPFESSGSGAISRFGRFNPIYRPGSGTGVILNHRFGREVAGGNQFLLSLGYLVPTDDAQDPGVDRGLFSGSYSAYAQLVYQPTPSVGVGFTYANAYFNAGNGISGGTGSAFANNPFNSRNANVGGVTVSGPNTPNNVPTLTNQFGLQTSIRLSPKVTLAGWVGMTEAISKRQTGPADNPIIREGGRATIWNWSVGLAFPDLFKKGSLGGLIFGMPPKVTDNDYRNPVAGIVRRREDTDTSYHLEAFYRYRLNDNIAITPGFFVIFNPEHNAANDAIFVGTVRTTFTF
jgi:hypothetical protein